MTARRNVLFLFLLILLTGVDGWAAPEAWEAQLEKARTLQEQRRYTEAETAAKTAVHLARDAYGPASPQMAMSLNRLGSIYNWQRKIDEAEQADRRALTIMEKAVGPHHPHLAYYLKSLALDLLHQQKYSQAEPLYRQALKIQEKAHGKDHPDLATTHQSMAQMYRQMDRFNAAESHALRSLKIREARLGPDHDAVSESASFLAALYESRKRYAEAETLYRQALAIKEKKWGSDDFRVASLIRRLAEVLMHQDKYAEAEALFHRAVTLWAARFGPEHRDTENVRQSLTRLYSFRKNEAILADDDGTPDDEAAKPLTDEEWDNRHEELDMLLEEGNYAEGAALAIRTARQAEQTLGPDHPRLAEALTRAAFFRKEEGRYDKAEKLYQDAHVVMAWAHGPGSIEASIGLDHLAILYLEQGKYQDAVWLFERTLAIWADHFGADHPTVKRRRERLDALHERIQQQQKKTAAAVPPPVQTSPEPPGLPPETDWLTEFLSDVKMRLSRLKEKLVQVRAAIAESVRSVRDEYRLDSQFADWQADVESLIRKFTPEQWLWIILGTAFLVFILVRDWN